MYAFHNHDCFWIDIFVSVLSHMYQGHVTKKECLAPNAMNYHTFLLKGKR